MFRTRMIILATCGLLVPVLGAPAATLELTGIVRDLKRGDVAGGHPDFETAGLMGRFGLVHGLVSMELGEDGKPVYNANRPSRDTIQSAESLRTWYNDDPEVNINMPLKLTLDNGQAEAGGVYTFHDSSFFPVDGKMFGNQGLLHNYHFTFELKTEFSYEPGQYFTFIGDDDVWVYINGKKVIDIGGVHGAATASVLLFDGKAFVERYHFATGGIVQEVDRDMRNKLIEAWTKLGMDGTCPIQEGDKFVDLDLNDGGPDVICEFTDTSVSVRSSKDLSNVVIAFEDSTEEKFDELNVGTSGTFAGTGHNAGKKIIGAWVKAGENQEDDGTGKGAYHTPLGKNVSCSLDFFFAERHQTQSNFRIDTSMNLVEVEPTTVSPLYD